MQQEPTNDTAFAGAVYVQTNAAPNELIAFRRADDGSLDLIGRLATGIRVTAEPRRSKTCVL